MRREHDAQARLTRYALTNGFSESRTVNGSTVTLSREGRARPFLITLTTPEATRQCEYATLSEARMAFQNVLRLLA